MDEPVNLAEKLALFDERFSPRIVATMNDYKHVLLIEPQGTRNTGDAVDTDMTAVERKI